MLALQGRTQAHGKGEESVPLNTIQDIIIALHERCMGKTHWEGCERHHVDCAAIKALQMFKELAPVADAVVETRPEHRDEAIDRLAKKLNGLHAEWLLTFQPKQD